MREDPIQDGAGMPGDASEETGDESGAGEKRSDLGSPTQQVLSTLRKPSDEAQFTQFIAAIADSDPQFPGRLANLLIGRAHHEKAAALLGDAPADLGCRAERRVWSLEGEGLGRVDLVFEDKKETFYLLIEHKLGSDYGDRQLERYRDALEARKTTRRGLLAITTSTPLHGEEEVAKDPSWLGSIRWSQIYDELRELEHRDPSVREIWRETLALMRKQGDFGPMDADPQIITGWAQRGEAEPMMRQLLEEVTGPTVELLDEALGRPGATKVIQRGKYRTASVVHPHRDRPHVKFTVPAEANEQRLWVQFFANEGDPFFSVEARYQHPQESLADDEAVKRATEFLDEQGFWCDTDGSGHYWARAVPVDQVVDGPKTIDLMTEIIRGAASDLAKSQIFDALAARPPSTPPEEPEDPIEPTDE